MFKVSYFRKAAVALGSRGSPEVSLFFGPITFQSQGVWRLNSNGFRGYPGVPIITHFACGQVPCKSQGVLALGFQCPYVFVGIWGYPFLLA